MSTQKLTFTIAGATGSVGGRAARQLLSSGHHVRALARNTSSPASTAIKDTGAVIVDVSVTGSTSPFAISESKLVEALTGSDGAFFLVPPHLNTENPDKDAFEYVDTVARAVLSSKVLNIVFLSAIAAHVPSGTGVVNKMHYLEKIFSGLAQAHDLRVTFVRPGYFFTNLRGPLTIAPNGILPGTVLDHEKKLPFTSPDDIGDQVAKQLLERAAKDSQSSGVRIVELAGPEDLSMAQIASIVSELLEKEVKYTPFPKEVQQSKIEGFGLSPAGASQFVDMAAGLVSGLVDYEDRTTLVRGPTHIKGFIAKSLGK